MEGVGCNELKVAEAAQLLEAIAGKGKTYPDYREGAAIEAVIDATIASAGELRWRKVQGC
jgi:hypothetical protein